MSAVLLPPLVFFFFFFNDTATTEIYTLSLHDALPILAKQFCRSTPNSLASRWCCSFGWKSFGSWVACDAGALAPTLLLLFLVFSFCSLLASPLLRSRPCSTPHFWGVPSTIESGWRRCTVSRDRGCIPTECSPHVLTWRYAARRSWLASPEGMRSEEHTSELQSRQYLVCR